MCILQNLVVTCKRFQGVQKSKSMDWFLYERSLRHERVKRLIYYCFQFSSKNDYGEYNFY